MLGQNRALISTDLGGGGCPDSIIIITISLKKISYVFF